MKHTLTVALMLTASLAFGQRQATLAQQKMCAEQARKIFHEDNPTRPEHAITWEYTGHYEPKTNTCYIMTHLSQIHGKGFSLSYAVYDAFEGRGYASYIEVQHDVMDCSITRPGYDEEHCKTSDEFLRDVDKYFGVGQ